MYSTWMDVQRLVKMVAVILLGLMSSMFIPMLVVLATVAGIPCPCTSSSFAVFLILRTLPSWAAQMSLASSGHRSRSAQEQEN